MPHWGKPTILHINVSANSGSTGRIAEGIGKLTTKKEWNTIIAYGRKEVSSSLRTVKIGNSVDQLLHGLQTRIFDNHGLASKNATKKFLWTISDINPDIVHLHNIHGYYLNYRILFSYLKLRKIPVVWTLHDCWPFTGHCAYFDYVECEKWKRGCFSCPQKNSYPSSLIKDNSKNNYSLKKELFTISNRIILVPVSQWLGELLNDSFLRKHKKIVIRNGIDISVFRPIQTDFKQRYGITDKTIVLGVASVWEKRKGFDDFLKLSKKIDVNTVIVLVGLSKKQMKKLPSNIIGIQRTENINELVELYNAAVLFFNPTYEDNYPTTNLEAISCGTPVVTYKTGGSVEAVNSDTGFVIEKGDWEKCVSLIEKIRSKGKCHYIEQCRLYAEENFDKDINYKKYIELYKELLL